MRRDYTTKRPLIEGTDTHKVFLALEKGATNNELKNITKNYSSCISLLRRHGVEVKREGIGHRVSLYQIGEITNERVRVYKERSYGAKVRVFHADGSIKEERHYILSSPRTEYKEEKEEEKRGFFSWLFSFIK